MRRAAPLIWLLATAGPVAAQEPSAPSAVFRASRDIVSVDVVVRDRTGRVVSDLTAGDFELREDGRIQELVTLSFQEVDAAAPPPATVPILARLGAPQSVLEPISPPEVAGRRLMILLFDLTEMEPDEVERGVRAATGFVDTQMTGADLVAVATLTWELTLLSDFSGDRAAVRELLDNLVAVDVSTGGTGTSNGGGGDVLPALPPVAAADARLRAIRLLADALAPLAQKKALLYFTAGPGNGADTAAELRAATTAAARANLAIYPVDTRGLQTVIPTGPAQVGSRTGEGLFSGGDVNQQFDDLTASYSTLSSMASATGGRLFTGVNDLTSAFARVQRDTAAYYLLGYTAADTVRDGRFRRVQVRVRRPGLTVDARPGYYADRDFAHMSRADREAQLESRLTTPGGDTGLTVRASTGWSRTLEGQFLVPITLSPTGLAAAPAGTPLPLDVLGIVEDEQGRLIARVRDTVDVPIDTRRGQRAVKFTSRVVLPPGRFTLKAVVRDNASGAVGTAVVPIYLPDLTGQSLAVSAPIVQEGTTTTVRVDVYDRERADAARLVVSAAIFRDLVRVYESDLRDVSTAADHARGARTYELSLPAAIAGRVLAQITVVDPATGRVASMRTALDVK